MAVAELAVSQETRSRALCWFGSVVSSCPRACGSSQWLTYGAAERKRLTRTAVESAKSSGQSHRPIVNGGLGRRAISSTARGTVELSSDWRESVPDRREFIGGVAGVVLLKALPAKAQPSTKVPRIGVLYTGTLATAGLVSEAFDQGLRERGYVEGESIFVERRFGDAKPERLADLAADLVRLNVDLIVTSVDEAIAAVRRQTRTIPIVMTVSTDPVAMGFVASLARPGGNVTGFTGFSSELTGKRLELLRGIVPRLSRVAIMWDPGVRASLLEYKATEEAARSLRLRLQSVEVGFAADIDGAFSALATDRAEALIIVSSILTLDKRAQIASLAFKNRLPSISSPRAFPEAGGLMAYAASLAGLWRHSAAFVDKILKGANPGDLPVERPTNFELVINMRTARVLGLTMPRSLLLMADDVIQ